MNCRTLHFQEGFTSKNFLFLRNYVDERVYPDIDFNIVVADALDGKKVSAAS